MKQCFNPYLPLTEHIPDVEPHVFGDRLYVYGSHDLPDGHAYCEDHYTVWSAPVNDLSDWKCEGVSYRRTQDPTNADDNYTLWAPDCAQGPDGRYYLYYCLSFQQEFGVAVSDSPAGPFEFFGHIKYAENIKNGKKVTEDMPFDPAVLVDDDGRIFLYYGSAPAGEKELAVPEFSEEDLAEMPPAVRDAINSLGEFKFGENSMVLELDKDMITAIEEPRILIPGEHHSEGTSFEGHGFFEASSIRKIRGKYYFVYSSHKSHELCYAISDYPDRGFVYGGTLISNGDIGLNGRTDPVAPLGNIHGGLVEVNGEVFIFYHRQTNGTEYSRQGCAEKVFIEEDGSIKQVPVTSCGLNEGPLPASGTYPAAIACHLTDPSTLATMNYADPVMKTQIRVVQECNQVFIRDVKDGAVIGFKYFDMSNTDHIGLEVRGRFEGSITLSSDEAGEEILGKGDVSSESDQWIMKAVKIEKNPGCTALYLHFKGEGILDMKTLVFIA